MRVLVRCDASSAIGIGHVMRSLALTQALRDGGDEVTLLTTVDPGALGDGWKREGAAIRQIVAQIGSADDAARTSMEAREVQPSWLVLDGYAFDSGYRSVLDHDARLLVIDDHGEATLRADLVVNGNLYGAKEMYPGIHGRLLAGPRYAMLRREFRAIQPGERDMGIILSLGGADPHERTAPLLRALAERGLRGRVVIGPKHRSADATRTVATALGWEPLGSPDNMANLLASAELAIVGSGTTTLECAALGVPMVAVRIADNQRRVATALEELGLALVSDGDDPDQVASAAAALAADDGRRAAMARAGPRLVDGQGAFRVASAMREALLTLRQATEGDARLLHGWRNDPATRAASFAADEVSWGRHVSWLHRVLAEPRTRLLVGELERAPIGVVRLERDGSVATMSITVAPEARSRGLAAPLIRAGLGAAAELGVDRADAFIRPDNVASRRAFAAAGFTDAPRSADHAPPDAVRMIAPVDPRR
jgi:UDP-2,4-diacetamido-2,4,6-trideoxy-beta-L-altropyranose hydrolase